LSVVREVALVPVRLMASFVLVCVGIACACVSLAMAFAGGVCVLRGRPEPRWLVAHRWGLRGAAFLLFLISGWLTGF